MLDTDTRYEYLSDLIAPQFKWKATLIIFVYPSSLCPSLSMMEIAIKIVLLCLILFFRGGKPTKNDINQIIFINNEWMNAKLRLQLISFETKHTHTKNSKELDIVYCSSGLAPSGEKQLLQGASWRLFWLTNFQCSSRLEGPTKKWALLPHSAKCLGSPTQTNVKVE